MWPNLLYNMDMKARRKPSSVTLPVWMHVAICDLARKHKRSMSGEIEFLVEEAIRNSMPELYAQREEWENGLPPESIQAKTDTAA